MTKRIVDTGNTTERIDPDIVAAAIGAIKIGDSIKAAAHRQVGVHPMKSILISAGPVYGSLDPNKIVSNRSRGIWALKFAEYLREFRQDWGNVDVQVILLVPDILFSKEQVLDLTMQGIKVIQHKGYHDYRAKCLELAPMVNAFVSAAAVVNWIPAGPYPLPSKMETHGYKEGDVIQVPFMLAPRVITEMKRENPKLTVIGCKLLTGATQEALIDAAYEGVLIPARCNVVVANDLSKLKSKYLVYPDRSVVEYQVNDTDFYRALLDVLLDEHYQTWGAGRGATEEERKGIEKACKKFDSLVDKYRDGFVPVAGGRVFGSLAVQVPGLEWIWLCSPREKGAQFTSKDAVLVYGVDYDGKKVFAEGEKKATLNAPLLIRTGSLHMAGAVLHLHEQLPGVPTVPYAPPGTARDNNREIPGPVFNIKGHGFIKCL